MSSEKEKQVGTPRVVRQVELDGQEGGKKGTVRGSN